MNPCHQNKALSARRWLTSVMAAGMCVLAGCRAYSDGGFDAARLREDALQKPEVRLADYTPFEWDRVFIYIAYWSEEQVQSDVGSSLWFPSRAYESGVTEGDWLLVFVRGTDVLATVRNRPLSVGFDVNPGAPITRDDAVFSVGKPNKDGWILLKPRAHPSPQRNAVSLPSAMKSPHRNAALALVQVGGLNRSRKR
jgi:hypothetical protein